MSKSKDRFRHDSLQDTESIVKYLSALGEGFRKGALLFSSDDTQLVLRPQGLINLEVEAKRKGGEMTLGLRFRWDEEIGTKLDQARPLIIQPVEKG